MEWDVLELLLGIIVAGLGWWISTLTARIVDLAERLAFLEGRIAQRDRTADD